MTPFIVALVLAAGAIGALARYATSLALAGRKNFPYAVLIVNVVASALGGVALGLADRGALSAGWHLILVTGICGGLSTFSTWSVESVQFALAGRWRTAVGSVMLNLGISIAVAASGFLLARFA